MDTYIAAMQIPLKDKKVGYRREFLREILKEVRIKDRDGRKPTDDARIELNSPTRQSC